MDKNLTLQINDTILHNAFHYAEEKGISLSAVVETFLKNFISTIKTEDKIKNFPISDDVKHLAGRMKTDLGEMDWKEVKAQYLMEKYGL